MKIHTLWVYPLYPPFLISQDRITTLENPYNMSLNVSGL